MGTLFQWSKMFKRYVLTPAGQSDGLKTIENVMISTLIVNKPSWVARR